MSFKQKKKDYEKKTGCCRFTLLFIRPYTVCALLKVHFNEHVPLQSSGDFIKMLDLKELKEAARSTN